MIGTTFQFAWEVSLIEWCQSNLPSFVISILDKVSLVGDTIFIVGILSIFYLCLDKKIGRKIIFNAVFALLIGSGIKNIFKRRRPYFDNENIKCLRVVEKEYDMYDIEKQGFSFPSLHSSNISTVAGTFYQQYKTKLIGLISITFSLIVGISRFTLGCHYPTDVLAGFGLGIFTFTLFSKFQDKTSKKYQYILIILIGLIGFTYCTSTDFYSSYGIALGVILSEILDDKYIHFKNTKSIIRSIARLAFACGSFLLVSSLLKLPFSEDILEASTLFAFIYRTFRYCVAAFVGFGLTPLTYKYNLLKQKDDE